MYFHFQSAPVKKACNASMLIANKRLESGNIKCIFTDCIVLLFLQLHQDVTVFLPPSVI